MKIKIFVLLFSLLTLLNPYPTYAHGQDIVIEKEVGEYVFSFTYDPLELIAGEPVPIAFDIYKKDSTDDVDFTDIWLRINKDQQLIFASGVQKANFGRTIIVYAFPTKGKYEFLIRFSKDGSNLGETMFELEAPTSQFTPKNTGIAFTKELGVGAVGGIAGGVILSSIAIIAITKRRHGKRKSNSSDTEE